MNRKTRTALAALVIILGLRRRPAPLSHSPHSNARGMNRPTAPAPRIAACITGRRGSINSTPITPGTRYVYGCYSDGPLGYRLLTYPCRATDSNEQAQKYIEVGTAPKNAEEGTTSTRQPTATQQQGTNQQPATLPPPELKPAPAKPAK